MFRRLPTFLSLTFAATVGLFALTSVLTAQPPTPPATTPQAAPMDGTGIKRNQEENLKLLKRFQEEVLRLAQRWEKSDNSEDKERAKSLRVALKLMEEKGLEKMFKEVIEGLGKSNPNGSDFTTLLNKDKKIIEALEQIIQVLETEGELARIQREIKELKDAIAAIQKLKREQENIRARTDARRTDTDRLSKDQKELAGRTQDVANALDKKNQGDKGNPNAGNGNKEEPKAEIKAEPKPGDDTAGTKADTGEKKSDTKTDGMGMNGMGNQNAGEPKPSDGMDGMSGMGKPNAGDKPSPMGSTSKAGEPKASGEPKGGPPMGSDPMKPSDGKPSSADSKSQGSGKGESKPSAGQSGGEGKPMSGQDGMGGMGQPSPGGSKSGGQSGSSGQQSSSQPKKDPAAQNVQQAVPQQQGAQEDIQKGDNKEASKKQDKAIDQLQKALEELEKRLKQLREKELEKLLANLEERVNRMLRMQIEVQGATANIDKQIKAIGGKANDSYFQKSQAESDKESQIIAEAEKTLKLMEGEGTAVVFAGVLAQVKGDMEAIQKRLNEARVGSDTQQIEQDVIDQLKMMLEALKKARQELQNKPSDPKPNDPNANKPNQKLIDLLNELKLVRSLQEQVNKRTVMYNKQDPGEQSKDPLVQSELKQLSDRQKVLQDMLHKIATEANQ